MSSVRSYTLLHGTHIHEGRKHFKGSVITTHLPLAELFANKFEETRTVVTPTASADSAQATATVTENSTPSKRSQFGKDVTANYDLAEQAGLRVFVKDGGYTIADEDKPTESISGPAPLQKADVKPFLKKYLKK